MANFNRSQMVLIDEQRKRGKKAKSKLVTILAKIQALIDEHENDDDSQMTNDATNLLTCLGNAKLELENAHDNYTTFL